MALASPAQLGGEAAQLVQEMMPKDEKQKRNPLGIQTTSHTTARVAPVKNPNRMYWRGHKGQFSAILQMLGKAT